MWNLNDVVEIEPRAGHSYLIVFDDGTRAVVDLSEYLDRGPMFAPLKDPGTYPRTPLPFREGSGEGRNPRLPLPLSLPLPRGERGYGIASCLFTGKMPSPQSSCQAGFTNRALHREGEPPGEPRLGRSLALPVAAGPLLKPVQEL